MKDIDVYGIGNAIVDLQFKVEDSELDSLGLEKAGMKLVSDTEQKAILSRIEDKSVNTASGGSGANTIIALSQLGAKVAYGCLVANDDFGKSYQRDMEKLGIETDTKPEQGSTGTCLVMITPDAERTMCTCLGVSQNFSKQHISEEFIKRSKWLYIEGYLLSSSEGIEAALESVRLAKMHGTKIAITFSDKFIVEGFRNILDKIFNQADLFFANYSEATAYFGSDEFRKISPHLEFGVITNSDKGAIIINNGEEIAVEPFPAKAVDVTGAGDIFAAGFLYGITQGYELLKSGKIACLLGSKVVSKLGPRLDEDLNKLIEQHV